jgi:hypothetical protein
LPISVPFFTLRAEKPHRFEMGSTALPQARHATYDGANASKSRFIANRKPAKALLMIGGQDTIGVGDKRALS